MDKSGIIAHITKELITYRNQQIKFQPFDIISKGILVNALMKYYVPQEFTIIHTHGTDVCGEIHITPLLKHNKPYKIKFNILLNRIEVKLMDENTTPCKNDLANRYDRSMRGL